MKNLGYIIYTFALIIHLNHSFSQDTIGKYDYVWQMGYNGGSLPPTGTMQMYFNYSPTLLDSAITYMDMNLGNASICNRQGELQLYTNGLIVFNAQHKAVKHSAGYNYSDYFDSNDLYGLPRLQAVLILPCPTDSNKYFFFHSSAQKSDPDLHPMRMGYSVVDMQADSGRGDMIVKNHLLVNGMLGYGQITGCKHANGKDWWVIVPKGISNCYYTFLLRDSTVLGPFEQCLGYTTGTQDQGHVLFTPTGDKYIRSCSPFNILMFDFDRCKGKLSDPINYNTGGAIALSPSGRYLYTSTYTNMYQFDMQAANFLASQTTVATYDGFIWNTNFPTKFYIPQLAPDGKIYISPQSSSPYLHVINYPDSQGIACNVVQRGVNLPRILSWGLPNHPHYRMGALAAICDTTNTIEDVQSNKIPIRVYPNPAQNKLTFDFSELVTKAGYLSIYDNWGKLMAQIEIEKNSHHYALALESYTSGMYYYSYISNTANQYNGKFVVVK